MKNDHYDTYQYIKDWCIQNQFSPKIFLQMGAYPNGFDKSIISQNQFFKTWAKSLNTWATIGIHPSVKASKEINTLQKEIKLFENLTGKSPEISRQHYLMLFMPDTYTNLIQLGIKEDNTMGYADSIGFRSSIAVKYPFFDLKINKISSLVVQPFAVMDGTLMQYMNLEKEEAYEKVAELISITQILGGDFVFLWHNNSFSDSFEWKGWKSVFEKMIAKAKN
jgi:hypothetical protein